VCVCVRVHLCVRVCLCTDLSPSHAHPLNTHTHTLTRTQTHTHLGHHAGHANRRTAGASPCLPADAQPGAHRGINALQAASAVRYALRTQAISGIVHCKLSTGQQLYHALQAAHRPSALSCTASCKCCALRAAHTGHQRYHALQAARAVRYALCATRCALCTQAISAMPR